MTLSEFIQEVHNQAHDLAFMESENERLKGENERLTRAVARLKLKEREAKAVIGALSRELEKQVQAGMEDKKTNVLNRFGLDSGYETRLKKRAKNETS